MSCMAGMGGVGGMTEMTDTTDKTIHVFQTHRTFSMQQNNCQRKKGLITLDHMGTPLKIKILKCFLHVRDDQN